MAFCCRAKGTGADGGVALVTKGRFIAAVGGLKATPGRPPSTASRCGVTGAVCSTCLNASVAGETRNTAPDTGRPVVSTDRGTTVTAP